MTERKDDQLLAHHIEEEMERYSRIENRLATIEGQMGELIDIWKQSKAIVYFIKVVVGIVAACAASYAFITGHFSVGMK